jgi:hypothetical protein
MRHAPSFDKELKYCRPQLVTPYSARKNLTWTTRSDEMGHAHETLLG